MLTQQKLPAFRALESSEEFSETRLEAIGFIFHGVVPQTNGKPSARDRRRTCCISPGAVSWKKLVRTKPRSGSNPFELQSSTWTD